MPGKGRPFQKGISGNPGGRPKVLGDVQELARQQSPEAINTLVAIMQNEKAPPAARLLQPMPFWIAAMGNRHSRSLKRSPRSIQAR